MGFALHMSIIIYAEHCEFLEKENKKLKQEILFLREQLEYKTLGLPLTNDVEEDIVWVIFQYHGNFILCYTSNRFHIISNVDVLQPSQVK